MKKLGFWHFVLRFIYAIIIIFTCFSLGYYLMDKMIEHYGWSLNMYTRQMFTIFAGVFIFGVSMSTLGRLFRDRQMHPFFEPINHALNRIGRGDFSVILEEVPGHSPLSKLVNNINHMAADLGKMEDMRQEFISNVSHEIQSPLTSISGFAETLKQDDLDKDERFRYLNIIELESRRLSNLSENLLKLTSLESDNHPFEAKGYRVDKQIRQVILLCEPQWQQKQLEMYVDLEPIIIQADEELLSHVWHNIIHNSIKFTPDRGEITIRLTETEDSAMVSIKDTGKGMCSEEKNQMFDRFYKADKSRNKSLGGSGLGLSIVKKIVDLHDGSIEVESTEGVGTEISIALPLSSQSNNNNDSPH